MEKHGTTSQVATQPVETQKPSWRSEHTTCHHRTSSGKLKELRDCRECAIADNAGGGNRRGIKKPPGLKAEFSPCHHRSKSSKRNCKQCKAEGLPGGGTNLCAAHNKRLSRCTECGPDNVACAQTEVPLAARPLETALQNGTPAPAGAECGPDNVACAQTEVPLAARPLETALQNGTPAPAAFADGSAPLEVRAAKPVSRRLQLVSGCEASAARIKLNEVGGAHDGSLSPAADCAILPTCSVTPSTSVRKRQASTDTAMSLDVRCRVNAEDSQPGFARCVREWARFCGESRRTCLGPNAPTGLSHRVIQRKPDLDREKEIRQEQMTWNRKSSCCIRYQPGAAHTAGLPTQIHEKTKRQATKASINMLAEQKAEHERARASERETHRARCNSDMEEQSGGNTEESDYANERDSDHERVSDGEGDANSDNEGQCGRNYEESDNENEDEREQEPEQEQELA